MKCGGGCGEVESGTGGLFCSTYKPECIYDLRIKSIVLGVSPATLKNLLDQIKTHKDVAEQARAANAG